MAIRLSSPLLSPSAIISSPNSNPNKTLFCASKSSKISSSSSKYAVLGAGFAGLSVAWHLLKHCPKETHICVDIYDEAEIGGGASGSSGGLLHPYSPKAKVLWRGAECWKECLKMLAIAESAVNALGTKSISHDSPCGSDGPIVLRRGILRPATAEKNVEIFKDEYQFQEICSGQYDAVIVCLGAKSSTLPELSGKLPLRTCRGVISQLELPANNDIEAYEDHCPSILSDAWLAFQGPKSVLMGSTWDWNSKNYSSNVTVEESSEAYDELLPKASKIYPSINKWELVGARAGLRAMPPLTPLGSLPLLGCIDDYVGDTGTCKYWLVSGLGARGLLYHGLLGKLMAEAVISSDEAALPTELTSWKQNTRKR